MTGLFWHPSDFDDGLGGLVEALADLSGESTPVYYDYWGAETPEEALLPISYWSKERIVTYCRLSKSVNKDVMAMIEGIRLDDLRALCLRKVGKMPTGNLRYMRKGEKGEWRNTEFYSLDVENINSML